MQSLMNYDEPYTCLFCNLLLLHLTLLTIFHFIVSACRFETFSFNSTGFIFAFVRAFLMLDVCGNIV